MAEIKQRFNKAESRRNTALRRAKAVEHITQTYIGARNNEDTAEEFAHGTIWSTEPNEGMENATSVVVNAMFPAAPVDWFILQQDEKATQQLSDAETTRMLNELQSEVKKWLQQRSYVAVEKSIVNQIFVGSVGLQHVEDEAIKTYPWRDFVIDRIDSDKVRIYLRRFRELSKEETAELYRQQSTKGVGIDDQFLIYTEIDYSEGTVRQEQGDKIVEVEDDPAYWILSGKSKTDTSYPTSYGWKKYPLMQQVNLFEADLAGAVSASSRTIVTVDPDSGYNPDYFASLPNFAAVSAKPEWIGIVSTGNKLNDWRFVGDWLQTRIDQLKKDFLRGIRDQAQQIKTATEARIVANEINASIEGLYSDLVLTLQLPLVTAVLKRLGNRGQVRPIVVAGTDAITRQASASNMVDILSVVGRLFPQTLQELEQNGAGIRVLKTIFEAHGLPTDPIIGLAKGGSPQSVVKDMEQNQQGSSQIDPRVAEQLVAQLQQTQPNQPQPTAA